MKNLFVGLVAVIGAGALTGCQQEDVIVDYAVPGTQVLHEGHSVVSTDLKDKQIVVLGSQVSYEAALLAYSAQTPEQIDFAKNQVLLVNLGERSSTGYRISVLPSEPNEVLKTWSVEVRTELPKGEGCIAAEALTTPYQFVKINTKYDLLIQETATKPSCSN